MYRSATRRNLQRLSQFTALAVAPEAEVAQYAPFAGVAVFEGIPTGDGRLIEKNALRWDDVLPVPLQYSFTGGGHDDVVDVGWVDTMERKGSEIQITGRFNLSNENGLAASKLVDQADGTEGLTSHVSIVMDEMSFAIKVRKEVMDKMDEEMQSLLDGEVPDEPPADAEGYVTVYESNDGDEIMAVTDAQVRAVTMVSTAAFKHARIGLTGEPVSVVQEPAAIAASAAPLSPPAAWFEDPHLTGPTKMRYTEDGRVYGHLAAWRSCHIAYVDQCVAPPESLNGYAYFKTGTLLTKEGNEVHVGVVTMDTGHAHPKLSAAAAMAHYENTGKVVADINIGHDQYGIWVAGALRPNVTEVQKRALRAASLSGDWRGIQGNRELIGALAVNTPGYAIPEIQGYAAHGEEMTLVASGIVTETGPTQKVGDVVVEVHPQMVFGEDWDLMADFLNDLRAKKYAAEAKSLLAEILPKED